MLTVSAHSLGCYGQANVDAVFIRTRVTTLLKTVRTLVKHMCEPSKDLVGNGRIIKTTKTPCDPTSPQLPLSTVIHFYFSSVQFSVNRKFAVSLQKKFGRAKGIQTILNKQLHPSTLSKILGIDLV